MVQISEILPNSLAEKKGVRAGDFLQSINGNPIRDVLDYRFYLAEKRITLSLLRNGQSYEVELVKSTYDDIGLLFATPLMDQKQSCKNKCIFCFIDQLPKGLRKSLYFKDDDSRLSFLHGNYITLTNLTDADIDRIIKMRFSPINISVHTTNPDLRVKMMKNPRAGEVLSYIGRIAQSGLRIHGQIVLCRGYNDGDELLRTMRDLLVYHDSIESVSVVPAGLTRFREGLPQIEPYSKEECKAIIEAVTSFADQAEKDYGARIFAAADELYVKAGLPIPEADAYEGYPQIENGVGMMRSLRDEVEELLSLYADDPDLTPEPAELSIATGKAAEAYFRNLAETITCAFPQIRIRVYGIENDFFGSSVTVAGLLTGEDLLTQLKDKPLGARLLLSEAMLRNEDELFLCGMTRSRLADALSVPVVPVLNDGAALLSAVFGKEITY